MHAYDDQRSGPTAASRSGFELHQPGGSAGPAAETLEDLLKALPCREAVRPPLRLALRVPEGETVRAAIDGRTGRLAPAADDAEAAVTFRSVPRKLSRHLAMWDHPRGVLVDGVPALRFALLEPKALLVLSPGCVCYVTERVVPYVGTPTPQMIAARQKCACCRLPLDATTRVVSHRCGAVYHHETAESHPEVPEKDRLDCLAQVGHCLCCRRPISLAPYLVWDPNTAEGLAP